MVLKTVDINDAKSDLPSLVEPVSAGTEVILTMGDTPVARIVPAQTLARTAGLHNGAIWVSEDFDQPLPEGFWRGAP